ncbi:hypothetical protein RhiirC2_721810, partial [Rhizophagus irregularis]
VLNFPNSERYHDRYVGWECGFVLCVGSLFFAGISWFWLWVLDLVSVDPEIQLLWQCNSARNLVLLALGFEVEFGSGIEFNFGLGFSKIQAELSWRESSSVFRSTFWLRAYSSLGGMFTK